MAKAGTKAKQGAYSATQHGAVVCQEVWSRASAETTLEVRTLAGETLTSHKLPEASVGHQVSQDGTLAYVLTGGEISEVGLLRRLIAIDLANNTTRMVAVTTSALPAVDALHVAYLTKTALVVERHGGERIFEKSVGPLGVLHGGAAHACALLPNNRVALSRGHRGGEKIADLTVFNIADGSEQSAIELPAETFHATFAPAALRADPQGEFVAILGFFAGLLIVDLAAGKDVAADYAPDPLDLADGRSTRHAHHTYSDLAFDADGERLAAAYSPGKLSVWARGGDVLKREWICTNTKARRIVTFGTAEVAFFDSTGAAARFSL